MLQRNTVLVSWGLGLSERQAEALRVLLGEGHRLVLFAPGAVPSLEEFERDNPCVLWTAAQSCQADVVLPSADRQFMDLVPKVLLLDEGYTLEDFEKACDCGISEIIRPPFTRERIADVLRRSIEAQSVHYDLGCLTREIMLERELLERKNELLNFLVNFLTYTTESIDIEYLLQTAYTGLSMLLPAKALHMVLWEQGDTMSDHSLTLHICAPEGSQAQEAWREALLEQARLHIGNNFSVEALETLHLNTQPKEWSNSLPADGIVLPLPIITGTERLGVLLLLGDMERHLGRDQAQALDSAMRHFALSVKNAQRFRTMQMYADYDALTRVHSRRHFEARLQEEMQRFARYGQTLSMIMLDIDHFKHINDTRGHHVGDIVLREVAALLADGIRTTDYCARYGGEEFVILLPHSTAEEAAGLAERMRKVIAQHTFLVDGGEPLKLTVSMGVTSLLSGVEKNRQALICEADAALYEAKKTGRNRVCAAPAPLTIHENAM